MPVGLPSASRPSVDLGHSNGAVMSYHVMQAVAGCDSLCLCVHMSVDSSLLKVSKENRNESAASWTMLFKVPAMG